MAEVVLSNLSKVFNGHQAISNVSLQIADGEFMTLLGPSGCGKSTTLNAIAGLDIPTSGRIAVGDRVFFDSERNIHLPTEHRNCGLVFQSYALWPHLSVAENVAFPLRLRKVPAAERSKRVEEVLALVEMEAMAGRYPHQLSGGQQQRVALARTLVYRPTILLLDEPLSNLDAKLREKARIWLTEVQDRVRLTTIFVTHDQVEALTMSDRVTVMNQGRIVQVGTPQEIYETPADPFVADFIGTSSFLRGRVVGQQGDIVDIATGAGTLKARSQTALEKDTPVVVAIRPERVLVGPSGSLPAVQGGSILAANIVSQSYLGARHQIDLDMAGQRLKVETEHILEAGEVSVLISQDGTIVFPDREAGK